MSSTLYVGVDVSMKINKAQFIDEEGLTLGPPLSFPNDPGGLEDLIEAMTDAARQIDADLVKVGTEATGLFWWHLQNNLVEESDLDGKRLEFYRLNPYIVKQFKKTYGSSLPKTDAIDAWAIANRVRFGHLEPAVPLDPRYALSTHSTALHSEAHYHAGEGSPLPAGLPQVLHLC